MTRRWFNVGVVKIAHADRDVAREVLGDRPDSDVFQDIVGADTPDDDERFPVGSNTTYRVALTDEEAERFREASNARYVHEDVVLTNLTCGATTLPGSRSRAALGYWPTAPAELPGTNVNVAVLDTGSSSTVRSYMNQTLVARGVFVSPAPPTNEAYSTSDHGSLCAANAVSYGGRLLDGVVINGDDEGTDSGIAQGVTWAVNQGAKVVSGSFGYSSTTQPATLDAINAASGSDVIFYFATGNEGDTVVRYPARYSISGGPSYLYAVGGFDMSTKSRWVDSSWDPAMTGVAPSIMVRSVIQTAVESEWYGTSAACPCVANMASRLVGAGVSARLAGQALAATGNRLGQGTALGGGVFDLRAAARYLGLSVSPSVPVSTRTLRNGSPMMTAAGQL